LPEPLSHFGIRLSAGGPRRPARAARLCIFAPIQISARGRTDQPGRNPAICSSGISRTRPDPIPLLLSNSSVWPGHGIRRHQPLIRSAHSSSTSGPKQHRAETGSRYLPIFCPGPFAAWDSRMLSTHIGSVIRMGILAPGVSILAYRSERDFDGAQIPGR
jgi:hypothetical protein